MRAKIVVELTLAWRSIVRGLAILTVIGLLAAPSAAVPGANILPPPGTTELALPQATQPPVLQPPAAPPQGLKPPATQSMETWRQLMARTHPPKTGCYTSSYPSTQWQEVPCTSAPKIPHVPPIPTAAVPGSVGGSGVGSGWSAGVSGSLISAEGSFYSVSGVASKSGLTPSGASAGQNSFSLQLNTNIFNFFTQLCAHQPECTEWQQFLYTNPKSCHSGTSCVYIQYWLIGHGNPCPPGPTIPNWKGDPIWTYYPGGVGIAGCYINGQATPVPDQISITELAGLRLTGNTSSSAQSAVLETPAGTLLLASDPGDLLAIGAHWNTAEFNVFGNSGGDTAVFNPGSAIVTTVNVDNEPRRRRPASPMALREKRIT